MQSLESRAEASFGALTQPFFFSPFSFSSSFLSEPSSFLPSPSTIQHICQAGSDDGRCSSISESGQACFQRKPHRTTSTAVPSRTRLFSVSFSLSESERKDPIMIANSEIPQEDKRASEANSLRNQVKNPQIQKHPSKICEEKNFCLKYRFCTSTR